MKSQLTVEDVCRKLKPIFGEKIDNLYFRYSIAESYEEKNEIIQFLNTLYQKNLSKLLNNDVLLEPPIKEDVAGEYPLATVSYARKKLFSFGLREKDWPRHMCVTGMSGSGKTNFAFSILKNFIEKDKPFLVFDWKKSFRPLLKMDNEAMCFTIGNDKISNLFKTNINRPPEGVEPREWINSLCDLITESFMVSFGVHKIILETLDEAFEGWGVYEGGKHYPNWNHIKKLLEIKARESKGRETGWYESALRVATVLTFGGFGNIVNYDGKRSLSVEDLFDKKVIFELNSLSNIEKKFFCEFILTYIYKLKKASNNNVSNKFNHAILVDEAHNVFLKNKTHFVSESVTDMVYREMREYGTSLICLDQHISKLSDTVTGNSACHVAFQQQLPEDIRDISALTQLSDKKETFSKLKVGSAVVKLSERHSEPFLIEVPLMDLREELVLDEKIKSRMDCIIRGIEVENDDPEFKDAIVNIPIKGEMQEVVLKEQTKLMPRNALSNPLSDINKSKEVNKMVYEISPSEVQKEEDTLTRKQKILVGFIEESLDKGFSLIQIERSLERNVTKRNYSIEDITISMNAVLEEKLSTKTKGNAKLQTIYIKDKPTLNSIDLKALNEEEKNFVLFLLENLNHQNSTVELYKLVGLSARKGNVVKNQLLERGLIKIEEIKYNKGWKKLIRLTNKIQ